jgi:hypothetical protein
VFLGIIVVLALSLQAAEVVTIDALVSCSLPRASLSDLIWNLVLGDPIL